MLTERLNRLVDEGIMRSVEYQERPVRHEYRLTEKGVGLYPVIVSLLEWGNHWLDWDGEGPPGAPRRSHTGEPVEPVLVDARTGKPLDPRQTRAVYLRGDGTRPVDRRRPPPHQGTSTTLPATSRSCRSVRALTTSSSG